MGINRVFHSHAKHRATPEELLSPGAIWSTESNNPVLRTQTTDATENSYERRSVGYDCGQNLSTAKYRAWPPRQLSLALQGGGSFGAFTWGVLDRLLQEPTISLDTISGASAGAVNAVLLACGLVEGGRKRAREKLDRFWKRITDDASLLSLMAIPNYPHSGTLGMFGRALSPAQFNPFDFNPLRRLLATEIDFSTLRHAASPKLLVAATRVRDGRLHIFRNNDITVDAVLASTCLPAIHRAVEIDGEAYWDGAYVANPPILQLVHESNAPHLLVVQLTPANDARIPVTNVDIDRRLDQIMFNSALNAEVAALDLARKVQATPKLLSLQMSRIAAENEIDGLALRSAGDLGRGFIKLLHEGGRRAADQWLSQLPQEMPTEIE
jgi:NTE family protein